MLSDRRQIRSWSQTCSEQKFGLSSSTSCLSSCARLSNTPFTRYNRLSVRLYNRFDNWLYRVNKHPTNFHTGCQTDCSTGLTTMLNEQPLFVQPVVKPDCTTGLTTGCTTGLTTGYIHDTAGCQTGCQTGLTTG